MLLQSPGFVRNTGRPVLAVCVAVPCLFLLWLFFGSSEQPLPTSALHLLVPATSSNADLCKLLLSITILHYPVPALINWKAPEAKNAYLQHIAKVETILSYLHKLEEDGAAEDDMVLILDGFDIWLQLRPEVMLKRYFNIIEATDARSQELYGLETTRTSILFGPDKICWPIDFSRPACWAVPEIPLRSGAWGPPSRADEHNMPRWLNSGTIMGPLTDMRDMFQATLDLVHANHTTDSDQFYFANVWGDQEYARLSTNPERLHTKMKTIDVAERWRDTKSSPPRAPAVIKPDQRTEYFVSLDYLSELFQTIAFYKQYLTWMRPDHSWVSPDGKQYPNMEQYQYRVPQDVLDSPSPYEDLERKDQESIKDQKLKSYSDLTSKTWENLELCINTITNQIPVLLHFTGDKSVRRTWWEKLWFQKDAEMLREVALATPERPLNYGSPIGGKVWVNGGPPGAVNVTNNAREGAMSDAREFVTWNELCGAHAKKLYTVHSKSTTHT